MFWLPLELFVPMYTRPLSCNRALPAVPQSRLKGPVNTFDQSAFDYSFNGSGYFRTDLCVFVFVCSLVTGLNGGGARLEKDDGTYFCVPVRI